MACGQPPLAPAASRGSGPRPRREEMFGMGHPARPGCNAKTPTHRRGLCGSEGTLRQAAASVKENFPEAAVLLAYLLGSAPGAVDPVAPAAAHVALTLAP